MQRQETTTPDVEFSIGINTEELISILDKLTEWAKGKEDLLVPVLEGLNN